MPAGVLSDGGSAASFRCKASADARKPIWHARGACLDVSAPSTRHRLSEAPSHGQFGIRESAMPSAKGGRGTAVVQHTSSPG